MLKGSNEHATGLTGKGEGAKGERRDNRDGFIARARSNHKRRTAYWTAINESPHFYRGAAIVPRAAKLCNSRERG